MSIKWRQAGDSHPFDWLGQFVSILMNWRSGFEKRSHFLIGRNTATNCVVAVVLILGRFTPERKKILDALRVELRRRNYLPVLFDFSKPKSRDSTETISTLAHLTRFIITDITDAKSIPQELKAIVPNLPSVPVQPILLASEKEYGMFDHFEQYPWVLKPYRYRNAGTLLFNLNKKVISPAERALKG
jgi:hypothetical protein